MKILKQHYIQFIFLSILLGSTSSWAAAELAPLPESKVAPKTSGYVAKNESIELLFNALSSETKKPFVLSKLAQRKKITGDFDISNPLKFLDKISAQIGLVWYEDGQTYYVYDNSELKNSVVILRYASLATLNEFLQRTGLLSHRYPIRGEQKTGAFYVSGPPIYVDLVINAANYLDDLYKNVDLNKQKISIIKLQHTFVGDRTYKIRDQEVKLSGIGKVIEAILANEYKELVTISNAPKPSALGKTGLTTPSPEKPVVNEKTQIKVISYPETNSLLVKGTQDQIELIEHLVSQLDVARRHIELSLWIIDIQKNALDELGIDWSGAMNIGTRGRVTFNATTASQSTLNGSQFLAKITALNSEGIAQIVSRPIILTQDNVPSAFDNNSTFYTKLEAERVASLEGITYGTLINVLPRFSTVGDEIEMMLDIEDGQQSAPGNDVSGLPVITRTKISTVARVPKGKSLLIGGYTRDSYSNSDSKIPFLGDLPLVGGLFRSNNSSTNKVVRIFLIQPKLLEFGSTWDTQQFAEPPELTPQLPMTDEIKALRGNPGANDGNIH